MESWKERERTKLTVIRQSDLQVDDAVSPICSGQGEDNGMNNRKEAVRWGSGPQGEDGARCRLFERTRNGGNRELGRLNKWRACVTSSRDLFLALLRPANTDPLVRAALNYIQASVPADSKGPRCQPYDGKSLLNFVGLFPTSELFTPSTRTLHPQICLSLHTCYIIVVILVILVDACHGNISPSSRCNLPITPHTLKRFCALKTPDREETKDAT